jgi:hypothetical protein
VRVSKVNWRLDNRGDKYMKFCRGKFFWNVTTWRIKVRMTVFFIIINGKELWNVIELTSLV